MSGGAAGGRDVIKYGRHLGRHLEFYQELEVRLKSSLRTADIFPRSSPLRDVSRNVPQRR